MTIRPVELELFHAGRRMDKHVEPQAFVTAVMHSVAFVAVLGTAVVTNLPVAAVGPLGYSVSAALLCCGTTVCWLRLVRSGTACLLLCCGTTVCFSFYTRLYQVFALPGYYAMQAGICLPTLRDNQAMRASRTKQLRLVIYLPEDWNHKMCRNVNK
jgi:hypothetical protein